MLQKHPTRTTILLRVAIFRNSVVKGEITEIFKTREMRIIIRESIEICISQLPVNPTYEPSGLRILKLQIPPCSLALSYWL